MDESFQGILNWLPSRFVDFSKISIYISFAIKFSLSLKRENKKLISNSRLLDCKTGNQICFQCDGGKLEHIKFKCKWWKIGSFKYSFLQKYNQAAPLCQQFFLEVPFVNVQFRSLRCHAQSGASFQNYLIVEQFYQINLLVHNGGKRNVICMRSNVFFSFLFRFPILQVF